MTILFNKLTTTAMALALGAGMLASSALAQDKVVINMHTTVGSNVKILGSNAKIFADRVNQISGGTIEIRHFEPGALVPAVEYFDALSVGALDSAWGSAGTNANKNPALVLFTSVPFGPSPGEMLGWLYHGGGIELYDEIYASFNVKGLPCSMIAPEAAGWFNTPIDTVDDLKGLKFRIFGLGGKTLEKLGVSTQLLAGGDIAPALQRGTIDGAEFANPAVDVSFSFHKLADYYYFPGWHQQSSVQDFTMNLDSWNALSPTHQAVIESACAESLMRVFAEGEALQGEALRTVEEEGVEVRKLSDDVIAALRTAWDEVVEEEAAANPDFARVYESYKAFREDYKLWSEIAYVD
ncbi:TRAP transporter substrate-binding protein [Sulfitobacter sp. W074]|uniref:TRAP transporter substrate-binding protein n=1 Tax=Sulfitobacter sp. W074 TaxID=2867026 RepID=UPI0021A4B4E2|nr:TRAP transporter substrate-binding protein [Sulfitobacter sp. W074]UWR38408.1 TRAP transporter substrate-binding protein [Sulfitobacter sp. W074]